MYKISILAYVFVISQAQIITNIEPSLKAETEVPIQVSVPSSKDTQIIETSNSESIDPTAPTEAQFEALTVHKFDHFTTDITDCAKSAINKYNSSEEITFLFQMVSSPEFLITMQNGNNDDVRAAVLDAIDPFFEKMTGFNHNMVVETMPPEIINWIKQTTILFTQLFQNAKDLPQDDKTDIGPDFSAPGIDMYSRLTKEEEIALNDRINDLELQVQELQYQVQNQEAVKMALDEKVEKLIDSKLLIATELDLAQTENIVLNKTLTAQRDQFQKEFEKEINRRQDKFDALYEKSQEDFNTRMEENGVGLNLLDTKCNETLTGKNDKDYRGCQTKTRRGYTCQVWTAQYPQIHKTTPARHPYDALEKNYCRNPGNGKTNWCYTTNPKVRWDYCDPIDPISDAIEQASQAIGKDVHIDWENINEDNVHIDWEKIHEKNKKPIDGAHKAAKDIHKTVKKHKVLQNHYYKASYNYVAKSVSNIWGGW